jgi:hypothetical protein
VNGCGTWFAVITDTMLCRATCLGCIFSAGDYSGCGGVRYHGVDSAAEFSSSG